MTSVIGNVYNAIRLDGIKLKLSVITSGASSWMHPMTIPEIMPVSIPQKYPSPLKRHQYHLRTFDAM